MIAPLLAVVLAGCACAALPAPRGWSMWQARAPVRSERADTAWASRNRLVLAVLSGLAGVTFAPTPWRWAVGPLLFVGVWLAVERIEPASARRQRERTRRELPHVVHLLALALSSGSSVPAALRLVEDAMPGPTAELCAARTRLELGVDPEEVWSGLAERSELAPLGRALARANRTGASPSAALTQLAEELTDRARADVEDRARAVGIKAALPLGLCLLPAFLLIGIVPLVVSALTVLRW